MKKKPKLPFFLLIRHQQTWVAGVHYARCHAEFVGAIYIGYPAKMTVKLKEHLQIRGYCSYYEQPSLIWSDENLFDKKVDNLLFDWSNKCDQTINKCQCACPDVFRSKMAIHFVSWNSLLTLLWKKCKEIQSKKYARMKDDSFNASACNLQQQVYKNWEVGNLKYRR